MKRQEILNTLKTLQEKFPAMKDALKEAANAVEFPLLYFQEREAEYRLTEIFGIPKELPNFTDIRDDVTIQHQNLEYYLNYDLIDDVTRDVLKDHSLSLTQDQKDHMYILGLGDSLIYNDTEMISDFILSFLEYENCDSLRAYNALLQEFGHKDFFTLGQMRESLKRFLRNFV